MRPVIPLDWPDIGLIALAAVATIVVHPVSKLLGHPYWLDESWVAVLTRAPLSQLPRLSSSAPPGFVALLRLAPGHGMQRGRIVVLGFSVLTVVATYVMVHALGMAHSPGRPVRSRRGVPRRDARAGFAGP